MNGEDRLDKLLEIEKIASEKSYLPLWLSSQKLGLRIRYLNLFLMGQELLD